MGFSRRYFPELNFVLTCMDGEINDPLILKHDLDFNKEAEHYNALKEIADCTKFVHS